MRRLKTQKQKLSLAFNVLGLSEVSSIEEAHKAYKSRVKEAHPDVGGDSQEFIKLQEAYKYIVDNFDDAQECSECHGKGYVEAIIKFKKTRINCSCQKVK